MDAHKLWMLRDFIGTNKVLFRIPVYQRNYDWSESNCNRLLDDIYGIMQSGDKHFLGTIVFMAAKSGGFALQEYIIIDGQQRLTTLMLILKALSVVAESVGDDCYHEIEEQYLHNKYCDEEFKVKLKPIKSDNNQFLLLLEDKIDEMDEDTHIYHNFMLCKERFERWAEKGINPSQVLDALTKLEIVEIVLTKGEDDPQVIFESINSTGLELSNADLIRNYLLMNADDQEKLYENYWLYIEKTLRNKMDYSNLDAFFMQYIVYKTSKPVNSRQLYNSFVKLFKDSGYSQESILKELRYYAEIFGAFVYGSAKYSERINRLLYRLRVLNQTTCYPFLLHVFDDYHQGVIDEETVEKIQYCCRRTERNQRRRGIITIQGGAAMEQVYLPGKIRDRIQDLMKSRKVTQAELAARIGCSESMLSRFISGKTDKLGDENIFVLPVCLMSPPTSSLAKSM